MIHELICKLGLHTWNRASGCGAHAHCVTYWCRCCHYQRHDRTQKVFFGR